MNDSVILDYIEKKGKDNTELLIHIHEIVKKNFPELECAVKWGMPHYDHMGIMCGIGCFKNHVTFFFHKGTHMKDPKGLFKEQNDNKTMRSIKYTTLDEIDEKIIVTYIQDAIAINEKGIKLHSEKPKEKTLEIPVELQDELANNPMAKAYFDQFPYYKKKEYTEWIASAKREETKQKRLTQAIQMIAQGIGKEDKYRNK